VNALSVLILILVVAVVAFVAFVAVQRKRRSGGVIAAKPRRGLGRGGS
jgi:preprotein translocase subunit SecG